MSDKDIKEVEARLNKLPDDPVLAWLQVESKVENVKLNHRHHNATLNLDTAIQELKLVVPTGTVSIKSRSRQKSEVEEEVEKPQSSPGNKEGNANLVIKGTEASTKRGSKDVASSPKIKHWPIIDIDNLPTTSPPDACHPPSGSPGFWCDITSPLPLISPCDEDPLYSSNTSTPHASVQTNSFVTEAPTLMIHVSPGRVHNVSHALNSFSPVTNNNKGSINLKRLLQHVKKQYLVQVQANPLLFRR